MHSFPLAMTWNESPSLAPLRNSLQSVSTSQPFSSPMRSPMDCLGLSACAVRWRDEHRGQAFRPTAARPPGRPGISWFSWMRTSAPSFRRRVTMSITHWTNSASIRVARRAGPGAEGCAGQHDRRRDLGRRRLDDDGSARRLFLALRAVRVEVVHDVLLLHEQRDLDRRGSVVVLRVDVRPALDQRLHGGELSVPRGRVQRREPVHVARADVRPRGDQQADDVRVAAERRDVEGREFLGVGRVHVRALEDQRVRERDIAVARRVEQRLDRRRRGRRGSLDLAGGQQADGREAGHCA